MTTGKLLERRGNIAQVMVKIIKSIQIKMCTLSKCTLGIENSFSRFPVKFDSYQK